MTKKSIIIRNNKRKILVSKFINKRKKLKNIIKSNISSKEDKWNAMLKFQCFPKDSIQYRIKNRCYQSGRSRSFIRRFGLSRIKFRESVILGYIPGIKKSSW
ncbi:30S ribosomal protein S14 [endosymbiont of Sipalinus gigas]|uniref:30S ribosomal protein S14 n=1 Tax=endosymbiont of Sipalinus gigas TaxID=1972134 RepID=UPI000DC7091E|nr:30S ribosomal protein S14 [endosymbiont of Sipalinus gigas]BBA85252.1 30S ribosomal protein S14 [endosymbiont of Sipalinus gigas]